MQCRASALCAPGSAAAAAVPSSSPQTQIQDTCVGANHVVRYDVNKLLSDIDDVLEQPVALLPGADKNGIGVSLHVKRAT